MKNLHNPGGLTLIGSYLYWSDATEQVVARASTADGRDMDLGDCDILYAGIGGLSSILIESDFIYMATATPIDGNGTIYRIAQ